MYTGNKAYSGRNYKIRIILIIVKNLFLIFRDIYFLKKYNHCYIYNIGKVEATQLNANLDN